MRTLDELLALTKSKEIKTVSVAGAEESDILLAVEGARKEGLIKAILVANVEELKKIADLESIDLSNFEIISEPNPSKQSKVAVELIRNGKADIIAKGLVSSSDYLKAILAPEGLKGNSLLSHVAVFEIPTYHKLLTITDAAVTIAPDINEKVTLINNAVLCTKSLGIMNPKVACVCAVEKVNPVKMPSTEHAAILSMMNKRGQITGCIVDGPFGLDNAISKHSAEIKKVPGIVAGDADIILADDIESANILYKSLNYFAHATCAAIVLGATAPVVLTSRADDYKTKLTSIALAALVSHIM